MEPIVETNQFGLKAVRTFDAMLAGSSGPWLGAIALFQNNMLPSPTMTSADLVLADFAGAGLVGNTAGPAFIDSDGLCKSHTPAQFISSGGSTNLVYGVVQFDTSSWDVLGAARFENGPYPMGDIGQVLNVVVVNVNGTLGGVHVNIPT